MKKAGVVVVVLVILLLAFASIAFTNLSQTRTVTISTTRTITFSSATSPVVIEEVIIQPEEINGICFDNLANSTSTAYLVPVYSNVSSIENQTARTTTETLMAITTTTIYGNLTMVSDSTTCTLINPYYNTTQSSTCPPCA